MFWDAHTICSVIPRIARVSPHCRRGMRGVRARCSLGGVGNRPTDRRILPLSDMYVRTARQDGKVATALGAVRRSEATAVWSGVV